MEFYKEDNLHQDAKTEFLSQIFELIIQQELGFKYNVGVVAANNGQLYEVEAEIMKWENKKCAYLTFVDVTQSLKQERIKTRQQLEDSFLNLVVCYSSQYFKQTARDIQKSFDKLREKLQNTGLLDSRAELFDQIELNESKIYDILIFNNIINDIHQIYKDEFKLDPTWFDIRDFLYNLLRLKNKILVPKKIQCKAVIQSEVPEKVYADKERIQQIILVLISKAIKHTQKGVIEIGTLYIQENEYSEEFIQLYIQDTGVGIQEKQLAQLKQKINTISLENVNFNKPQGIPMVSIIAQKLGSKLEVSSVLGKGTRISFNVQVASQEDKSGEGSNSPGTPSFKKKSLLTQTVANPNKCYLLVSPSNQLKNSLEGHLIKCVRNFQDAIKTFTKAEVFMFYSIIAEYEDLEQMESLLTWLINEINYPDPIVVYSQEILSIWEKNYLEQMGVKHIVVNQQELGKALQLNL